jgi:outer membrane protein OmpA-like peptidoglycan-associated protein
MKAEFAFAKDPDRLQQIRQLQPINKKKLTPKTLKYLVSGVLGIVVIIISSIAIDIFDNNDKLREKHQIKQEVVSEQQISFNAEKLERDLNSLFKKSIEFEYNSDVIKSSSYENLWKLVALLEEYSGAKIEIGGHASEDPGDDAEENQILSEERARAVYDFLVGNGVRASRLTYVGYGHSKPIANNTTKKGREKNKRVEFKVIK